MDRHILMSWTKESTPKKKQQKTHNNKTGNYFTLDELGIGLTFVK